MRQTITALLLLGLASTTQAARDEPKGKPLVAVQTARTVDIVIALDTSNSMDGLIDSARQKLWDVVNLLAQARPRPALRVGLISYGNDGYDRSGGWVRKESDLTPNLDLIYEKLFALRTNGGTEFVARAVHQATSGMHWTQDAQALRIIFVAGNEPADQDRQITLESAIGEARQRRIFVNSIYCGGESSGEAGGWRKVASLGAGQFAAIDQSRVVAIATPMDAELSRLSTELNGTYVAYGARGAESAARQAVQDTNAASTGGHVAASRAAAKSSALYANDEWDLVDAKKKGAKEIGKMKAEELPPEMRAMSASDREAFVEKKAKEREALQKKIADLSKKRSEYISTETAKRAPAAAKGLDEAMNKTVRKQAESAGFAF